MFRGVLLEQILRSLPQSDAYTALAIALSSAVFASLHFVKRPEGRQARSGSRPTVFSSSSCLFGLAYVVGGRSLWLPIAVHGAAVFAIEVPKLYVAYHGPRLADRLSRIPPVRAARQPGGAGLAAALVLLV